MATDADYALNVKVSAVFSSRPVARVIEFVETVWETKVQAAAGLREMGYMVANDGSVTV